MTHTIEQMSDERALDVVHAMVGLHMHFQFELEGAFGPGESLEAALATARACSLREMIEANAIIDSRNTAAASAGGPFTITVVCDDRLIAALYTALHYDPGPQRNAESIVCFADRALLVVRTS